MKRIGPDVMGMCELMVSSGVNDNVNFPALSAELGLPYNVFDSNPTTHRAGIASRYPIAQTVWVYNSGMTRRIPLARIDVPNAEHRVWVAMLHLKSGHTNGSEQHIRAAELYWLRQAILTNCDVQNDIIVIMGDFNLVSPTDVVFQGPGYYGVQYPLSAWKDANGYFTAEQIFKLDLRHAGTGGETYTWRSDGIYPNSALDHMMVSAPVRTLGAASEIYDVQKDANGVVGLAKYGLRPPATAGYASDHLPIFADLEMAASASQPPVLSVDDSAGLNAEGPVGGAMTPATGNYVLHNTGSSALVWAAEYDASWLSLSSYSGTIPAGGSTVVQASLAAGANGLSPGGHQAALRFVNRSSGLGNKQSTASVFVGPFVMDGVADAAGYTVSDNGITLRVAVRGTRLYIATQTPPNTAGANDHHIFVSDSLLADATEPAPWAKRGMVALPAGKPYLAAEGSSKWAGWFNAKGNLRLYRSTIDTGVLEGSIDMIEEFGAVPEFVYVAAVAYETADASPSDAMLGRVMSQVPPAVTADDNITADEFLRVPVRSITDSAVDGRFDVLVPGRGFAARVAFSGQSNAPEVRWNSVPGRTYRVWRSPNLTTGSWQQVAAKTASQAEWEGSWPDVEQTPAFYRVELLSP